ncbi:MAG: prepilin-type N-terminal cleavage/methylation domain-containing protein [Firmicutes bacterium]|nr:prepilin-type N-terminal cleavage/methylation domain-containing protein [Bacillota bacterium]
MKQKGFTLIELLAVVVILGVLMVIAIPSVSSYITASRKQSFIDSAKSYIAAAKAFASDNGGIRYPHSDGESSYIQLSELSLEKGEDKSAFDAAYVQEKCYIRIVSVSRGYDFYITLVDTKGNTLNDVKEQDLTPDRITTDSDAVLPYDSVANTNPDDSGESGTDEAVNLTSSCNNSISSNYIVVYAGDVDADGEVSNSDLLQFRRFRMQLATPNAAEAIAADLDCNRMIDDSDESRLRSLLLGAEPPLNRIPASTSGASAYIINDATLNDQGLYKVIN